MLIGLASAILFAMNGRIFGVSGFVSGLMPPKNGDTLWRVAMIVGLIAGGFALSQALPDAFDGTPARPLWMTAVAGLLVGYGTSMGGGCTSGHGICGMSRMAPRSMAATLTFLGTGIAVATLVGRWVRS